MATETKPRPKNPSFAIVLEALPSDGGEAGVFRRLKAFLKSAKRSWGLRCTSIRPAAVPGESELVHRGPELITENGLVNDLPAASAANSGAATAANQT